MKRKAWWTISAAILGGLALVEIIVRLTGAGVPPPQYCPDGSPRGKFRYGARNRHVDAVPNDVARYIVCFGDSWTFGLGVKSDETWPARLEVLLKKHDPDARVVNAAVSDAAAADVLRIFRPMIERYRAKEVVVFVGAQDATPVELWKTYPLGAPFHQGDCARPWFRLAHLLGRRWLAFDLRMHPLDPESGIQKARRRSSVTAMQIDLFGLTQTAADLGVTAVFVTYPKLPDAPRGPPFLPLESRYNFLIHAIAQTPGMREVDLEKRWGERTENYLLPWLLWPHPNVAGHADIATAVAAAL